MAFSHNLGGLWGEGGILQFIYRLFPFNACLYLTKLSTVGPNEILAIVPCTVHPEQY